MILNPMYKKGGIVLPTLSNPAVAADLRNGKQLVDQYGKPITGTMPNVSLNSPSISVNSNGLITASASMSGAGYSSGGSKSGTLQLSSAHNPNFTATNIKKGVNIFGVTGTYEENPQIISAVLQRFRSDEIRIRDVTEYSVIPDQDIDIFMGFYSVWQRNGDYTNVWDSVHAIWNDRMERVTRVAGNAYFYNDDHEKRAEIEISTSGSTLYCIVSDLDTDLYEPMEAYIVYIPKT